MLQSILTLHYILAMRYVDRNNIKLVAPLNQIPPQCATANNICNLFVRQDLLYLQRCCSHRFCKRCHSSLYRLIAVVQQTKCEMKLNKY